MIDFHCHIDLYPNPTHVLDEVENRGIYVLAVTTTPRAWSGTQKLVGDRRRVRVGLGLHLELVATRHHEVALLCGLLPETRYVGEIGIDGSPPHRGSIELQRSVFCRILAESAKLGGRTLSIHSRGAVTDVLNALEGQRDAGTAILHWFSGTQTELRRAIALGCWFSVGPAMLRSRKGQDLVRLMPIERILTETDAPFARDGDQPFMPWQAFDALPIIATVKEIDVTRLAGTLMLNLQKLGQITVTRPARATV